MHTHETDGRETQGLGAAVKEVAERASSIVRLELELPRSIRTLKADQLIARRGDRILER